MKTLVTIIGIAAIVALGCNGNEDDDDGDNGMAGTGGDNGAAGTGGMGAGGSGSGGSDGCAAPAFDIAGVFNERYNCREIVSQLCAGQDVETTVSIMGSFASGEYTFENTFDETMGEGKLCGNVFEWTSQGVGFTEMGEWTFSDADNVTIETTFERLDGTMGECVAVATRDPATPGPPPDLECMEIIPP